MRVRRRDLLHARAVARWRTRKNVLVPSQPSARRAVCPITIHQPISEVEGLIFDHIREHVLNDDMVALVVAQFRAEIEAHGRSARQTSRRSSQSFER